MARSCEEEEEWFSDAGSESSLLTGSRSPGAAGARPSTPKEVRSFSRPGEQTAERLLLKKYKLCTLPVLHKQIQTEKSRKEKSGQKTREER